ncbi:MAG TPA: condensation domain-containing protein, partial [Candidatus Deferrimicrobium sp.]|nr:condensation domain-containing protein [Candidatus Deferrimicrobium sp.]
LSSRLPGYMVPSFIVLIKKISLTPNGKVDLGALPGPEAVSKAEYIAPQNEVEEKLTLIWSEILGIEQEMISMDANFFELGGHSLKATILVSRIHRELNVSLPLSELFRNPTIRGLAAYMSEAGENSYQSIMPVEAKEYYRLSFAQQRMYILQQMDLNSTAYNMPQLVPLAEQVDMERLAETFKKLIERHESLRTSFHMIGDEPVQVVHQEVEFKIAGFENRDPGSHAFDLSKAPLLRVGAGKHLLFVDMHHIISDGISHQVLREDFQALYNGRSLVPLRIQYKDFAHWQNSPKETERIHGQMLYWLNEFSGEIPVLELPLDYPRPLVQSFEGASVNFELTSAETRGLNELALQGGATLFMVLAAAVNILLAKLGGREEIIIGTPVAGRRHADLEKIIGMFVNTLALRNYPVGERTFSEFLGEVKERILMVFENQEYPFEGLVDKLALKRDVGRNPLFDVMFSLQNIETVSNSGDPQAGHLVKTAKFDLTITAVENGREMLFTIQYGTKLFKPETIERFSLYFKKIVSQVIANPVLKIKDIEIIPEQERHRLLIEFNNTASDYPADKTIPQLFIEQMAKTPDRIALVGADPRVCPPVPPVPPVIPVRPVNLTYRQLHEQSGRLAASLIEKGVMAD